MWGRGLPRPSRKSQIMDAALACYAEQGYAATRLTTIAARAAVSEAAIYRHFSSIEELGAELYVQYFTLYATRLAEAIGTPGSALDRLRFVVRVSLALYREHPDAFLFGLEVLPAFIRRLPVGFDFPLEQLERVIRDGQSEGSVRAGQTNILAAMFLGALLRPIGLTRLAAPGALDLRADTSNDTLIEEAALALLRAPAR